VKQKLWGVILGAALSVGCVSSVQAGTYSDKLARCLVNAATEQDNVAMVQWIYSVLGMHKDLKGLSQVSDSQRQAYAKKVQEYMLRAYTVTCNSELQDASLFEGHTGVSHAGEVLGESVMSKVFLDQNVINAIKDIGKIDPNAIVNAPRLQPQPPAK
jgi:hypothetical protein